MFAKLKENKKLLNIINNVISWLIIIFTIFVMLFTIFSIVIKNNDNYIFGHKFLIVRGDSMSATDFYAGDLIMIKKINPDNLEEGDIITFISTAKENFGEYVTHKIRLKIEIDEGIYEFLTYGTTTNVNDDVKVTETQIVGVYVKNFPFLGWLFSFLRSVPGYIICVAIPFILVIIYLVYKWFILFKEYKTEQKFELMKEKERSREMEKEIENLKEQLRKKEEVENEN